MRLQAADAWSQFGLRGGYARGANLFQQIPQLLIRNCYAVNAAETLLRHSNGISE